MEIEQEGPMSTRRSVESMSDAQTLTAFGTGPDAATRGFDSATHTRVMASELIRARERLAHYRTLYAAFLEAGEPFMIENLDEAGGAGAVPAKLVFTDDPGSAQASAPSADVVVWSEAALLDALARERTIADFFTNVLDELESAASTP
jgi:hypothetical protein